MIESVIQLPFNRHVGIQQSSTLEGLLELPAGEQYLNHIGTVHASAQLALAEACSGEFLLQNLSGNQDIVPVVRRVEAKFKKPANGRVTATVKSSEPSLSDALSVLDKKRRALVTIFVDVVDETGQHSLSSSFEWFLAKSTE